MAALFSKAFLFLRRRAAEDLIRIIVQHGDHGDLRPHAIQKQPSGGFTKGDDHVRLFFFEKP